MAGLQRVLGVPGATFMGLGSILGTGVFVAIGLGSGLAGPMVLVALLLAAGLAFCNGLSLAALASVYPVSGGTYAYANQLGMRRSGFLAGVLFVSAKVGSAAAAALGFAAYLDGMVAIELNHSFTALSLVIILTVACAVGLRRTSLINTVIVSMTVGSLLIYIYVVGTGDVQLRDEIAWRTSAFLEPGFWQASAVLFVAYTGYGRVATLGEEIRNPERNIPKAILSTIAIAALLYVGVATVTLLAVGSSGFFDITSQTHAPLEVVARQTGNPLAARILSFGALTAMLGVILNLLLGVSRVVYAMSVHGDLPRKFAEVGSRGVPLPALLLTSGGVVLVTIFGGFKEAWSFSAFTVLAYYTITNLAALRLAKASRRYNRTFHWAGLGGCLLLIPFIDASAALVGCVVVAVAIFFNFLKSKRKSLPHF